MHNILKIITIISVIVSGAILFYINNQTKEWNTYSVMSSSMEPAIKTGSLIITEKTRSKNLKIGDIITFIAPIKEKTSVTHRIINIKNNKNAVTISTKGDNNNSPDPWQISPSNIMGKVKIAIPHIGYIFSILKSKIGIVVFIIFPSLWIIFNETNNIIKLLKNQHKIKTQKNIPAKIIASLILINLFSPPQTTNASLSDSAIIEQNKYIIISRQPEDFPSCNNPTRKIISSYDKGSHEIIGIGRLEGSDTVYQITQDSKDKILQCFCPESGTGIQTNWLKIKNDKNEYYNDLNWPFSINSGLSWNLDDSPYIAQNTNYNCKSLSD